MFDYTMTIKIENGRLNVYDEFGHRITGLCLTIGRLAPLELRGFAKIVATRVKGIKPDDVRAMWDENWHKPKFKITGLSHTVDPTTLKLSGSAKCAGATSWKVIGPKTEVMDSGHGENAQFLFLCEYGQQFRVMFWVGEQFATEAVFTATDPRPVKVDDGPVVNGEPSDSELQLFNRRPENWVLGFRENFHDPEKDRKDD